MANTSFSSGFGAGIGLGGIRVAQERNQMMRQQQQQERQQQLRQNLDKTLQDNLKYFADNAAAVSKSISTTTEPGKRQTMIGNYGRVMDEMTKNYDRTIDMGVKSNILTAEEGEMYKNNGRLAQRLSDPMQEARAGEQMKADIAVSQKEKESAIQQKKEIAVARAVDRIQDANRPFVTYVRPPTGEETEPQIIAAQQGSQTERSLVEGGYVPFESSLPGVGQQGQKNLQPIPEAAQQDFTNSFAALQLLDVMAGNVEASGVIEGPFQEVFARLGWSKGGKEFNVARNQFKLMAQSLIKGTPSNFDVQTVIATLPSLMSSETVNKARIKQSRELFKQLIKDKIAFYKGTNKYVPPEILEQGKKFGINSDSIQPTETYQDKASEMVLNKATDRELEMMWKDPEVRQDTKERIAAEFRARMESRAGGKNRTGGQF